MKIKIIGSAGLVAFLLSGGLGPTQARAQWIQGNVNQDPAQWAELMAGQVSRFNPQLNEMVIIPAAASNASPAQKSGLFSPESAAGLQRQIKALELLSERIIKMPVEHAGLLVVMGMERPAQRQDREAVMESLAAKKTAQKAQYREAVMDALEAQKPERQVPARFRKAVKMVEELAQEKVKLIGLQIADTELDMAFVMGSVDPSELDALQKLKNRKLVLLEKTISFLTRQQNLVSKGQSQPS